jgi:undecaprenyl-diphosphatase
MDLSGLKRLDWRVASRLRQLLEPIPPGKAPRRSLRIALAVAARSADSLVLIPLLLGLGWLEGFTRRGLALSLGAAYVLSVVFTAALKLAFRRRRPPGQWGALYRRTDPHSFPSGHASRTAAMAVTAWAFQGWALGLILLAWSVLVSLARVVLGVHYTLDIVVGYLLGLVIGLGIWILSIHGIPF